MADKTRRSLQYFVVDDRGDLESLTVSPGGDVTIVDWATDDVTKTNINSKFFRTRYKLDRKHTDLKKGYFVFTQRTREGKQKLQDKRILEAMKAVKPKTGETADQLYQRRVNVGLAMLKRLRTPKGEGAGKTVRPVPVPTPKEAFRETDEDVARGRLGAGIAAARAAAKRRKGQKIANTADDILQARFLQGHSPEKAQKLGFKTEDLVKRLSKAYPEVSPDRIRRLVTPKMATVKPKEKTKLQVAKPKNKLEPNFENLDKIGVRIR